MPVDPIVRPKSKAHGGRIAAWTVSLLALAGLIDALTSVVNKTQSLTCLFGISLPWCAPQAASNTIADFTGEWTNKNPRGEISHIEIDQRLNMANVHIWGRCTPSDCDWGSAQTLASNANEGALQLRWDPGFAVRKTALTIGEGKRLQVATKTHFTDQSGRPDYDSVDYLERK